MLGGGGMTEQDSAVVGGGGTAEQDASAVTGGGGIADPASAVMGGGSIADPASAVMGGGSIAEQDASAVTGGGGIAEQDRAVDGGGGITEQDSAVLGGGGMNDPERAVLFAPAHSYCSASVNGNPSSSPAFDHAPDFIPFMVRRESRFRNPRFWADVARRSANLDADVRDTLSPARMAGVWDRDTAWRQKSSSEDPCPGHVSRRGLGFHRKSVRDPAFNCGSQPPRRAKMIVSAESVIWKAPELPPD